MIACCLACVMKGCSVIINHVKDYPLSCLRIMNLNLSVWGWQPYFNFVFIIFGNGILQVPRLCRAASHILPWKGRGNDIGIEE